MTKMKVKAKLGDKFLDQLVEARKQHLYPVHLRSSTRAFAQEALALLFPHFSGGGDSCPELVPIPLPVPATVRFKEVDPSGSFKPAVVCRLESDSSGTHEVCKDTFESTCVARKGCDIQERVRSTERTGQIVVEVDWSQMDPAQLGFYTVSVDIGDSKFNETSTGTSTPQLAIGQATAEVVGPKFAAAPRPESDTYSVNLVEDRQYVVVANPVTGAGACALAADIRYDTSDPLFARAMLDDKSFGRRSIAFSRPTTIPVTGAFAHLSAPRSGRYLVRIFSDSSLNCWYTLSVLEDRNAHEPGIPSYA